MSQSALDVLPRPSDPSWELVDRARDADHTAFSRLYERYVRAVFGFVLNRTRDWALAEEITSETFLRAFSRMETLTYHGTSFRSWVLTIARNLIIDEHKSARRRYEVFLAEDFDRPAAEVDPASVVCGRDAAAELRRAMTQLTDAQRQCLVLRFFEHLSVHEVAVRMRRTDGSVRALQMRAVRALAAHLTRDPAAS